MTSFAHIALALALCAMPGWASAEGNPCQLADVEQLLASGPDGLGGTGRSGDDGIGGTGRGDSDGLGGTGFGEDDGIGGTGIYGTLTRFGSLCINGLHVLLDDATAYERNGQAVGANTLALGQVLWVETSGIAGPLRATRVVSDPTVQGQVQSVDFDARSFVVAGRRVQLDAQTRGPAELPGVASFVEVSGLLDEHGTIRASWLAHRDAPVADTVGPDLSRLIAESALQGVLSIEGFLAASEERGGFRVGGLPVLAPTLANLQPDTRVWLSGTLDAAGELMVDSALFRAGPSRLHPGRGAAVEERLPSAQPREASAEKPNEADIDDKWIDELLGFGPTNVEIDLDMEAKTDDGISLETGASVSGDSKRGATESIDSIDALELEPPLTDVGGSITPRGPTSVPDRGGPLDTRR